MDQHAREGELSDGTPYPPNADVIRVLVLSLARAPSDGDEVKEANVLLFDNHERVAVDEVSMPYPFSESSRSLFAACSHAACWKRFLIK